MGKSFEKHGIVGCHALVESIVKDMLANGFTQHFPVATYLDGATSGYIATLEAGPTIDPNASTQPWRVRIEAKDDFTVQVNVAHPIQLPDDGTVSLLNDKITSPAGLLSQWIPRSTSPDDDTIVSTDSKGFQIRHFIDRSKKDSVNWLPRVAPQTKEVGEISRIVDITPANNPSFPMSYRLTTTDHGVALFVWEEASDSVGNRFSWFVVQRSVDSQTGVNYATGKSPVYCVYSASSNFQAAWASTKYDEVIPPTQGSNNPAVTVVHYLASRDYHSGINRFVVRELDTYRPSKQSDACLHTEDSRAIINPMNQVAITEDNKYVITFPNGLNTPRFAYTHELDLIATTSADVVSQWSEVPLTVYGETAPRVYRSMCANGANNTGLRIMMLQEGPSTTPA